MGTTIFNILCVNAGSSNVKLSLYAYHTDTKKSELINNKKVELGTGPHNTGSEVVDWLKQTVPDQSIDAVGHRVVHGGPNHYRPELVSDELLNDLRSFSNFDPEHLPFEIKLIDELVRYLPDVKHVACFDTGFFHDLPPRAKLLPLPRKYESDGLRRYGFHGLSYAYLQQEFSKIAGEAAVNGRVIFAHLGSGASLAATKGGLPVDTTMSFTPTSGLVMSSRSGDIDPGLALLFSKQYGLSPEQFNHMVNFESGLLGVSELSGSMLTLLENEPTDKKAAEAIELFVYATTKAIGSLSAALGGLDSLIFSGGIGEPSSIIRSRICDDLGFLGVDLDQAKNNSNEALISSPASTVGVHVIPTNEAAIIVQQVSDIINIGAEVREH